MGVFLSLWVFEEQSTIVMVLLTVMACVPLMYNTIKYEEKKDLIIEGERSLLKEHAKALTSFMFLFLGLVAAFSAAYLFLPGETVENLFSSQTNTINEINSKATGEETITAGAYSEGLFLKIFSNNLKVLLFCVFFSFFYGAGAIFILTWNATVISAAIGNFFRTHIGTYAAETGLIQIGGYFHVYALSLMRYFTHGLPEILSYFVGGLAGGLISVAMIKHEFGTKSFGRVLKDSTELLILAIVILFLAGMIEVYITPRLMGF
jgi:uncharacterized membrane protein SpoIIM required for sporulation